MLPFPAWLTPQKQDARQQAAGKTVFASPGDNLSSTVSRLQPGDTLILRDGLYAQTHFLLSGVNGTSVAPITIRAEHDGQAILDGGGDPEDQAVLEITGSSYITVEGLVVRNGGQDVVGVYHADTHHILIRRVTAYNAGAGNHHVFDVAYDGVNHVVLEDDAGWGQGRYIFIAYHANDVTFRRTWARWSRQSLFSPAPRSCYGVYGSSNTTLENTICTHALPDQPSHDYFVADWQTSDGPATAHTHYLGVMFFDNWEGLWVNNSTGQDTHISNSYFETNRQQGAERTSKDHGDGVTWASPQGGSITTSTFVNNEVGFSRQQGAGSPTISNSVFVNNGTAILGDRGHSRLAFWQNATFGVTITSSVSWVDSGYEVNKYGRGAYLFVPACSPLKHAGQGGTDIGANILYRYQNGTLTTQPLWPWPLEERIKTETGSSVTWASAGGIWKTLDGVYSQQGGPAACAPSSFPVPPTFIQQEPAWSFSRDAWEGVIAIAAALVTGGLLSRFRRRRR
jgi:hypothetical protein